MRLLGLFQQPDYYPLDRGESFPQFHEDNDRYMWHHPGLWNYRFWIAGVNEMPMGHNTFDPAWLQGGEL